MLKLGFYLITILIIEILFVLMKIAELLVKNTM